MGLVAAPVLAQSASAGHNPALSFSYLIEQEAGKRIDGKEIPRLTPTEAMAKPFLPLPSGRLNLGFTDDRVWIQINFEYGGDQAIRRYLQTKQRYMRPMIVYERTQNDAFEEILYNDETQPFSERPTALRDLTVPLTFAPGESKQLLVYAGAGGELRFDFELADPNEVDEENLRSSITTYFFLGLLTALVLVNLSIFAAVRHLSYLAYAVNQTFIALYILHIEGFAFQYLWPNWPALNANATQILGLGVIMTSAIFAALFLRLKQLAPYFYQFAVACVVIAGGALVLSPWLGPQITNTIGTLLSSISPLFFVIAALVVIARGQVSGSYFALGWVFLSLGAILSGLTGLGIIQTPLQAFDWIKLGTLLEALLLSFALSDQVRRINNNAIGSQKALVDSLEARLEEAKERLMLEQENEETNQALSDLDRKLATTSHDVSQPIASLKLTLSALSASIQNPEVVMHLNSTLDNMESLLRENLDNYSADPNPRLTFGQLFTELKETHQEGAQSKGIEIRTAQSNLLIGQRTTPIRRIISNLTVNAIRHSGCNRILLGLRRLPNQQIRIEVHDNGRGLPVTNDPAESRGHGLGMTIVKEICAEHDWSLEILSTPQTGVLFRITLTMS